MLVFAVDCCEAGKLDCYDTPPQEGYTECVDDLTYGQAHCCALLPVMQSFRGDRGTAAVHPKTLTFGVTFNAGQQLQHTMCSVAAGPCSIVGAARGGA